MILPATLLLVFAAGILYVRLHNGPISLKVLAAPIARAIAADLPGLSVTVEDASVRLSETYALEFRLTNVRFSDSDGAPVALAPLAAVRLNPNALWSGRIAPARVVLIEPRLLLLHSAEQGLTVSFARPAEAPTETVAIAASTTTGARRSESGKGEAGKGEPNKAETRQFGVAKTIASLLVQARQTSGTASYLRGIGLRNAALIFDTGEQQTVWRITEAEFGVNQRRNGVEIGGDMSFAMAGGAWHMSFAAQNDEATDAVKVDVKLSDLVPRSIAGTLPEFAPLAAFDIPVSGDIAVQLSRAGEVRGAKIDLALKPGSIVPGWAGAGRVAFDGGEVALRYVPEANRLELLPSRISSGSSWARLAGAIMMPKQPANVWSIDIGAVDGMLAAEEFGLGARPLEALRLIAAYDGTGFVDITEASIKAAGGEFAISGRMPARVRGPRLSLKGKLSPMSVEAAKLLWPEMVAPGARRWAGRQVQQGRITGGNFIIEDVGDRTRGSTEPSLRTSMAIEATNVRLVPKQGMFPVDAPRVLVRYEGNVLEVVAPDAAIVTTPQRRLPLKAVRFFAPEVAEPSAMGELTFRAQGTLPATLDIVEQQAARTGRSAPPQGEGLDGRVDATARIMVPLGDALSADDTKIEIKGRVTEGKARGVLGTYDVNGATIAFETTDQSFEAKGDMLLGGINAKLSVQRIFAAADAEQPPLRLTATLDAADRTQLGLDLNDVLIGDVPVEISVAPRPQGDPLVQLRADLTGAELLFESLAWRKPPGRTATLQFDVAKPSKQRVELQNFKIVGDDIALSGSIVLDAKNRVREFSFPEFSLNIVSRLVLSGVLRNENVWDVTVRGTTYDGRDFFQSLYSVGQLRDKPLPPRKEQAGLEIKAEIDTLLGYQDISLKTLRLYMSKRGGRLMALTARGTVEGNGRDPGKPLEVTLQQSGKEPRRLVARTDDAGQLFRLVGFYPNMQGGRLRLDVNLDGSGPAEKTGLLLVERFGILGDPIALEPSGGEEGLPLQRGQKRVERQVLQFDSMRAPFSVGHGQFVIEDADLRGQVLGVVLRGKADFRQQYVDLGGTYVPLQGLNSAIGAFPILGQILAGPRGEGVFGVTFQIVGPMARPQVLVNPASIVPGILRETMQMTNPTPRVTPRDDKPAAGAAPKAGSAGAVRSFSGPQPTPTATDARREAARPRLDADGGWSSQVTSPGAAPPQPAPAPGRR